MISNPSIALGLEVAEPDEHPRPVALLDQRRGEQVGSAVNGRARPMSHGPSSAGAGTDQVQ